MDGIQAYQGDPAPLVSEPASGHTPCVRPTQSTRPPSRRLELSQGARRRVLGGLAVAVPLAIATSILRSQAAAGLPASRPRSRSIRPRSTRCSRAGLATRSAGAIRSARPTTCPTARSSFESKRLAERVVSDPAFAPEVQPVRRPRVRAYSEAASVASQEDQHVPRQPRRATTRH